MPAADLVIPRYDHRSNKPSQKVILDCQCGRLRLSVPYDDIRVDPPPLVESELKTEPTYHAVVDCHCPSCRKYHVADRATYLLVPADKVQVEHLKVPKRKQKSGQAEASNATSSNLFTSFDDSCQHLGQVTRYQCSHCRTKLATQPRQHVDDTTTAADRPYGYNQYFLNLGAARDDSLPKKWTKQWRAFRYPWQYNNQCVWTRADAENDDSSSDEEEDDDDEKEAVMADKSPYYVTGGCACGTYRYQVKYRSLEKASTELQHCYCQLCRRLTGGPFQTWMPVPRRQFRWMPPAEGAPGIQAKSSHEPPLHRYTSHGRRHVCDHCGGVLTILYDADGVDVIWPAAGGLDDASLPKTKEEMSKHLYGVCHICCRFRQAWYALPNDGNSRIADAS